MTISNTTCNSRGGNCLRGSTEVTVVDKDKGSFGFLAKRKALEQVTTWWDHKLAITVKLCGEASYSHKDRVASAAERHLKALCKGYGIGVGYARDTVSVSIWNAKSQVDPAAFRALVEPAVEAFTLALKDSNIQNVEANVESEKKKETIITPQWDGLDQYVPPAH